MASDPAICDDVTARLTPLGPVAGRRMFGGFGIFIDGLMFGLIAHDRFYLKVDDGNRENYEATGMEPFTYQGKTKPVRMSYWQVPGEIYDDPGRLAEWAEAALAAARRAKTAKKPPKRRKRETGPG